MLYKFKSKAAGDVIMLQANGKRVLDIIGAANGRDYEARGILQPAQMQDAIAALNAAIDDEEADQKAAVARAVAEVQALLGATRTLSCRVFYFTLYSLGLRLSEGLALKVSDIDGARQRVHIRDSKGKRDRLVPLPRATLDVLRKFWLVHRHPELLFPNRAGGLAAASRAPSPLDRGGVQNTLRQVALDCGLKKRSPRTACAIAMQRT